MLRMGAVLLALAVLLGAVPAADADHPGWPKTLRLGLIITESGTLEHWQPVMSYLEKKLGIPVKAYVGTDYTATADPISTNVGRYGFYSTSDVVIRYSTTVTEAPSGQAGNPVH